MLKTNDSSSTEKNIETEIKWRDLQIGEQLIFINTDYPRNFRVISDLAKFD